MTWNLDKNIEHSLIEVPINNNQNRRTNPANSVIKGAK